MSAPEAIIDDVIEYPEMVMTRTDKRKKLKTRFVENIYKNSVKSVSTFKPEQGKMTVIIAKNYNRVE